ncbi:ImmA/IrrE family metallo-endopeptidase [Paenibacillus sp. FSL H8-0537]|uniref:ImmA/IrrE family metallo-endopeptidase n=1 Tax=Paenibacillus sp. FSL H8-0537 TaxID=2921399 RepID=UPI003100CBF2
MRITSENLDETISLNEQIDRQVQEHIRYIERRLIKWKSLPIEEQALGILKEHNLVEIPIPDGNWGGAIRKFHSNKAVPIINTAQPRIYQYFIYWHEIYHLTENEEINSHNEENYNIMTEFDLNERKADYFASQMIFGYADLLNYFYSLEYEDFIVKIAHCMKSFKAPYKAVLIQLYQIAKKNNNEQLQNQIKLYFDKKWTPDDWKTIFQEHALDDNLIKPSFVTNLNSIINAIKNQILQHPDVELFKDNLKVVKEWEEKYKNVQRELKERSNE